MKLMLIPVLIRFLWSTVHFIVRVLPLSVSYKFSELIANIFTLIPTSMKHHMQREIKKIFPSKNEKEIECIIKKSFGIFTKRQIEALIFGSMDKKRVCQITDISGEDRLKSALQQGKGAIILLSHFGSFLMALPALYHRGYKINQLVGPTMINNVIQQTIFDLRKNETDKLPIHFFHSDQSMRQVVRALHNNELVALAFDGREGGHWENVDFLNQNANIASGFLRLADKTGAAIIPTFVVRQENDKNVICFEQPFFVPKYSDRESYYHQTTQEIARSFEGYINRFPDHFVMTLARLKDDSEKNIIEVPLFNESEDI